MSKPNTSQKNLFDAYGQWRHSDWPVVSGPLLCLSPEAGALYHSLRAAAACSSDAVYIVMCLMSLLHQLLPVAVLGCSSERQESTWDVTSSRIDPLTLGSLVALAALLALQCMRPAAYKAHRRTALAVLAVVTLAGDVAMMRELSIRVVGPVGCMEGPSGTSGPTCVIRPSATQLATPDSDAWDHPGPAICSAASGTVAAGSSSGGAAHTAPWGGLAEALLVRSGVSMVLVHSAALSIDFQWRVAMQAAEVALIVKLGAPHLARALSCPRFLPLLRRLHAALWHGAVSVLMALAALPLPAEPSLSLHPRGALGAALRGGIEDPAVSGGRPADAHLALAMVVTTQIMLGLALPLWVIFLRERTSRSTFVRRLQGRAAHDSALAAAASAPPGAGGAPGACCCGDPSCDAGLARPSYTVQGLPDALLQCLFVSAHATCFLMATCAVWCSVNWAIHAAGVPLA